jgi:hypothetical protein
MAQPKGHTGNPNGRPKGALNKTTSTVRSWLVQLINDNREQIEQDFKSIEPKERLDLLQKLLPYLMPKVTDDAQVQGACYDTENVQPAINNGWNDNPATVNRWYEMEQAG